MLLQKRYHLVKLIGQGGFGKTFLAVDEGKSPPVPCVVKQLSPQNQSAAQMGNLAVWQQEATSPFQQQVQWLEALGKHPQIPDLIAHFEENEYLYLVHEFIDGTNLARVVDEEGTFSETQIWQLLDDVLPVLKFIHDRQVIHRDIKPENIIRRTPRSQAAMMQGKQGSRTVGAGLADNFEGKQIASCQNPPSSREQGREIPCSSKAEGDKGSRLVLVDFGAAKLVDVGAVHQLPLPTGTSIGSPEYVAPEQLRGKAVFASDLYSLGVTCIYLLTHIPPFDLFDVANDCWAWRQYVEGGVSDRLCKILDGLLQNAVNCRFQSVDEVIQAIHPNLARNAARTVSANAALPSPASSPSWQCTHILSANSGLLKRVNSVDFSSTGEESMETSPLLASGGDDKTIRLWNPNTGQLIRTLSGHSQAVNCVAFSPDKRAGKPPLLASASDDKTIKLWNYDTGKEICTLLGHSHTVKSAAFSSDGQLLASGSWDKTVKLWDVNTGKELCTLTGHKLQVSAIALSHCGQLLASASFDRTVRLYWLSSLMHSKLCPVETLHVTSLHSTLIGHCGHVFAVAFSPDGKTIASASDDNTIKLWNINTGQAVRTLLGHSWSVVALTFTPDGQTLLSSSWDKTVKLWKVSTGEEICTLDGHTDSVCAVAINSTNQFIASGSKDKTLRLWQRKPIKN